MRVTESAYVDVLDRKGEAVKVKINEYRAVGL
jgi:hypothetical protein